MLKEKEALKLREDAVTNEIRSRLAELYQNGGLTPDDKEFVAARRSYLTPEQAKHFEDVIKEGLDSMQARAGSPPTPKKPK